MSTLQNPLACRLQGVVQLLCYVHPLCMDRHAAVLL